MGYEIRIHPDLRVAQFRFFGVISVATARRAFEDYVAHPDFDPGFTMISDAREVTELDASYRRIVTNILGLARPLRRFDKGALSIVLVGDETTYGMVRMLEQVLDFFSAIQLRPVWSEEEALALAKRPEAGFAELFAQTDQEDVT
ncbi:hypothetical protein [Aliiroseovarius sp.]|uniref:hypothetical protein n=1 Tax=Aliiroseovarius sp. TaxID=1872442 RepID=UPI003BA92CF4